MRWILVVLLNIVLLSEFVKSQSERVVGGKSVTIKSFPFQLAIIIKKTQGVRVTSFRGGAVIVSAYWALTAAHCIQFIGNSLIRKGFVYLRGNTSAWHASKGYNDHKVNVAHVHPKYNNDTDDYDLAIVKVANPFKGKYEKSINVAGKGYVLIENSKATVSGWGRTNNDNNAPPQDRLRAVEIKIVNMKSCKQIFLQSEDGRITDRMLCAWGQGKDACVYDSGGPLVQNNVLIGVVSWGMKCASMIYPGVYVKLPAFYDFLKDYERQRRTSLGIVFTNK